MHHGNLGYSTASSQSSSFSESETYKYEATKATKCYQVAKKGEESFKQNKRMKAINGRDDGERQEKEQQRNK